MDIKTDFIPKNGDVISQHSNGKYKYSIYLVCPDCGKGRWTDTSNVYRQNFQGRCVKCSNSRAGIISRRKQRNGYIKIRLSPDDPFYNSMGSEPDSRGRRYCYEHRIVMARHLGRPLTDDEVVHHKPPGIKDDNRIENLELFISDSEHQKGLYIELRSLRIRVTQLEAEVALLRGQLEKEENNVI